MSMNSFSNKLDLKRMFESLRSRKLRQTRENGPGTQTSEQPLERQESSITLLEGITPEVLHEMRTGQQHIVNLNELKKRYETIDGLGRRVAPRFSLQVAAIISTTKSSFRTSSVDISASGVRFKDLLPESFSKGPIEILLVYEQPNQGRQYMLFYGEAVSAGPLRTPRVIFKASAPQASETLHHILSDLTPLVA